MAANAVKRFKYTPVPLAVESVESGFWRQKIKRFFQLGLYILVARPRLYRQVSPQHPRQEVNDWSVNAWENSQRYREF